jgi:hypothetical protein
MNRYGHSYQKECDITCGYAKDIKLKDEIIEYLLDVLAEENEILKPLAIAVIKAKFGVDIKSLEVSNYDWN